MDTQNVLNCTGVQIENLNMCKCFTVILCMMVLCLMSYSTVCSLHGVNRVATAVPSVLSGVSEML